MKKTQIITITTFLFVSFGVLSCKTENAKKKETIETKEVTSSKSTKPVNDNNAPNSPYIPQEMDKDCNQPFDTFFERFAKDSVFQKNRIKYPLKWFYYKDVTDKKPTVELVEYGSFDYVDFTKDNEAFNNEYDKYEVETEKKENLSLYKLLGIDNGIHVTYKFKLVEGCWYMVEILDEST